jgi:peptidoglycan biosynthesis protein MviN/MurJ (putative lipid II flippase)
LRGHGLETTLFKAGLAAGVMGVILWLGKTRLPLLLPPSGLLNEVLLVGGLVVVGGGVYLAGIALLKVEEVEELATALKKQLKQKFTN